MTAFRRRALLAAAALPAGLLVGAGPAAHAAAVSVHEVYPVPANGVFTLAGHGYGHGHGMSQFGAYGAALDGLGYAKIVAFYYPGTTLKAQPSSTTLRVLIHAAEGRPVTVEPRSGATLVARSAVAGVADCPLPVTTGKDATPVTGWRAKVVSTTSGTRLRLQRTTDGSTWRGANLGGCADAWSQPMNGSITFADGGIVRLVLPSGGVTRYRGQMRAAFTGGSELPVNVVPVESYLRSVVPSEMPSSWSAAALQAQAVAARSYAMYGAAHHSSSSFDLYDDTRSQMYTGVDHEVASTDSAIKATAGQVLVDGTGAPIFAEFGSSSGGWTADGGMPYLTAHKDPYDGVPQVSWSPHSWRTTLSAGTIASAFPSVGHVTSLVVTGRDGNGQWGGRVTSITVHGTSGDLTTSGIGFRSAFGLRSEWFRVVLPPARPTYVRAVRTGSSATVSWQPPNANGGASASGYTVRLSPGGATKTVGAAARTASFTGLSTGTDYVATVVATSSVGPSYGTTVTTKVDRIPGTRTVRTAVAISRATVADGAAKAVVLVAGHHRAAATAAGPLAAAVHAPVLVTKPSALPSLTEAELERVAPEGATVYLLGSTGAIADSVATTVQNDGFHPVRLTGSTTAAAAVAVAHAIARASTVSAVYEVAAGSYFDAWSATPAAARAHAVLLLTNGTAQAPETASWIAHHSALPRYAVGAAAQHADPAATPVGGTGSVTNDVAIANAAFTSPRQVGVVAGDGFTALAAAVRLGRRGPLVYAPSGALPSGVRDYLAAHRGDVARVDLVGGGLPYYPVESGTQAALLG